MDQQDLTDDPSQAILDTLGTHLAGLRDTAVKARASSGIEDIWLTSEEQYLGIDDLNRADWQKSKWAKPTSMNGPLMAEQARKSGPVRSTLFPPVTARYVDAGTAKVCEILISPDDKSFSFDPTPVPDLIRAQQTVKNAPPVQPGQPIDANAEAVAQAQQIVDQATDSAKRAEKRVYDWMVEAKFSRELRKTVFDAGRIGTGGIKGPIATVRESRAVLQEEGRIIIEIEEKLAPTVEWFDVWNLFPDPSCGENIHHGSHLFERDFFSPKRLADLKGMPGYIDSQIDRVLMEGPGKCFVEDSSPAAKDSNKDKMFTVWYGYAAVPKTAVQAAKSEGMDRLGEDVDMVFAIVTLVNDSIIRLAINPLESGRFPHRVFPWRRRPGHWAGIGISEQGASAQKIITAGTRTLMNNAGRSAGVQFIIDQGLIQPATPGDWSITPDKVWLKGPEANGVDDVRKAFFSVEIPDRSAMLMSIIEYGFRLFEESTNIPLISQGQSGKTTPDTYGAAALQNNNANQLLREIAETCDDCITEPMVTDFYEWLLLDPDVPPEEKGDFQINAHGSSALAERAIQDQTIQSLLSAAPNPVYGLNPKLTMQEWLRSKRIDPRRVSYTEDEYKQIQQNPVKPWQVQVAELRAQTDSGIAQMNNQTRQEGIKAQADRDAVFANKEMQIAGANAMSRREELQLKRDLAILDYANRKQISLDQIKGKLADSSMRLSVMKDLTLADHMADLHKHRNPSPGIKPPIEPPGRAPAGEAFER